MPDKINRNTVNADMADLQRTAQALGINFPPKSEEERRDVMSRLQQAISAFQAQAPSGSPGTIEPIFSPRTGEVSAIGIPGRPAPSQTGGALNELIALQTAKTKQELDELTLRKKRIDISQAERKEAFQEELRKKKKGEISPIVPSIPTDGRTPLQEPSIPIEAAPQPEFEITTDPKTGELTQQETEASKSRRTLFQKSQEERIKTEGKRAEEASKANVNFEKTVNLFSGIIAQQKGREEEQGGLGLIPGLIGEFNVAIKNPEFSRTASAFGQRAETAFALNSVLTGQNRVIRGVINMILRSLPSGLDPDPVVAAKTAQSIRNAFMITRSFQQAGLTKEILSKMSQAELNNINVEALVAGTQLSPEEEAFIEAKINAVLATPPAKERFLRGERGRGITGKGIEGEQINIKSITQISE